MVEYLLAAILFAIGFYSLQYMLLFWNYKRAYRKGNYIGSFYAFREKNLWTLTRWESNKPTFFSRYDLGLFGTVIALSYGVLAALIFMRINP